MLRSQRDERHATVFGTRPRVSGLGLLALGLTLMAGACATTSPTAFSIPVITWEDKLEWMMRLEDQRVLRDPNPPAPVVLAPATRTLPAVVAPLPSGIAPDPGHSAR